MEKPIKKSPVEPMLNFFECMEYIEKTYGIDYDNRSPRENSFWLWLIKARHITNGTRLYLATSPIEVERSDYPEKFHELIGCVHKEFADNPDDPGEDGICFWLEW